MPAKSKVIEMMETLMTYDGCVLLGSWLCSPVGV